MKKAFSMIELIFVIILIGILAYISSGFIPDNKLLNDTNYILMKIKEKQKDAIGYDINGFSEPWSKEESSICIKISKEALENLDKNSSKPHVFYSEISVDGNSTICFDEYGRVYQEHKLLNSRVDINVTYGAKTGKISVLPYNGYVTLIE